MQDVEKARGTPPGSEDRASEDRIRATFATTKAAVVLTGIEGRVVLANRAYCELLGYREAELRALPPFALLHPDDLPGHLDRLRQLLAGESEQISDALRCRRKAGDYITQRFGMSLVRGSDGKATHLVAVAEEVAEATRPDAAARPGAAHILLVDDDSFIRRYATEMLTQLGYRVTSAASGPAALAKIRGGEAFDLLFTDIVMPGGMNGRELVAAARQLRPALRVLYTSGFMSSEIVRLARHDPSAQLLEKPYRRVDLARAVRTVLQAA